MHLVRTSVSAAQTSPADAPLVFAFDRLLNPATITRQSFSLRDAFGQAPSSPIVVYDPVARTVTLSNASRGAAWLLENQPYRVVLGVPKDGADLGGVRAIDGATLENPVIVEFLTTRAAGVTATPTVSYCADVAPKFKACAGCHDAAGPDAGAPYMGLAMTTEDGLRASAIGRVARQLTTGARAGVQPPGAAFAVNMPIIDPGNPGNSYLIYKLLSGGEPDNPDAAGDPAAALHAPLAPDEAARLREQIIGAPMPVNAPRLSFGELELVRAWIAQGAKLDCP